MRPSLTVTARLRARIALQHERIEHYTAIKQIDRAHHCFINQMRDQRLLNALTERLIEPPTKETA